MLIYSQFYPGIALIKYYFHIEGGSDSPPSVYFSVWVFYFPSGLSSLFHFFLCLLVFLCSRKAHWQFRSHASFIVYLFFGIICSIEASKVLI